MWPTCSCTSFIMIGGSFLNYACLEIVKKFARYTFLLATLFIQLKDAHKANRDETLPTVRLVNGSKPWLGRVEVYHNGIWGTVCDGNWAIEDARVVCRQLEFDGALAAYTRAKFGQGQTLPILLDNAGCRGYESRIQDCYGNWGEAWNNCGHSEDAGVECQAGLDEDTNVVSNVICTAVYICLFIVMGLFAYHVCEAHGITLTNFHRMNTAARNLNTSTVEPAVEKISVLPAPPGVSVPLSTARPPPDGNVSMTVPSSAAQDLPPNYDVVMEDLNPFVPPPGQAHTGRISVHWSRGTRMTSVEII